MVTGSDILTGTGGDVAEVSNGSGGGETVERSLYPIT